MIQLAPMSSIHPKDLKIGHEYLCGIASTNGVSIDWSVRQYDGEKLRLISSPFALGSGNTYPVDEEFCYSRDGHTEDYLLFELPTAAAVNFK